VDLKDTGLILAPAQLLGDARLLPTNAWLLPTDAWLLPANTRLLLANAWLIPSNAWFLRVDARLLLAYVGLLLIDALHEYTKFSFLNSSQILSLNDEITSLLDRSHRVHAKQVVKKTLFGSKLRSRRCWTSYLWKCSSP